MSVDPIRTLGGKKSAIKIESYKNSRIAVNQSG